MLQSLFMYFMVLYLRFYVSFVLSSIMIIVIREKESWSLYLLSAGLFTFCSLTFCYSPSCCLRYLILALPGFRFILFI